MIFDLELGVDDVVVAAAAAFALRAAALGAAALRSAAGLTAGLTAGLATGLATTDDEPTGESVSGGVDLQYRAERLRDGGDR